MKLNIEQNHAILAGHTFEHEIALAAALGVFGSLDINRGDYQSGWDTDQFAMNVPEMALAFYEVLKAGGFTTGGMNFDAKIRRQSIDPDDLLHAHVGSMDACARGLLIAAQDDRGRHARGRGRQALCQMGRAAEQGDARRQGKPWRRSPRACSRMASIRKPKSGRQEYLENLLNTYFCRAWHLEQLQPLEGK